MIGNDRPRVLAFNESSKPETLEQVSPSASEDSALAQRLILISLRCDVISYHGYRGTDDAPYA
jgi:hypothetical protein